MLVPCGLRIADRRVGGGPLRGGFRRCRASALVQRGALAVGLLGGVRRRGLCPSIRASVGTAIGASVGTSLRPAIGTRVRTAVGTGVGPVLGTTFGTTVGTAFGTTVGAEIRTAFRTTVGPVIRTTFATAVGAEIRTTLGTAIRATLGTAIGTEVRTTFRPAIRATFGTTVGAVIRTTLGTTIGTEIRTTLATAIRAGVGTTIGTSVRPVVRALSARILSLRGAGITTIAVRCAITASGCIHLIPVNSLDRTPRARVSRYARSFLFSQIVGPTRDSQRCHRSHRRPEVGVRRAGDPATTPGRAVRETVLW